LCKFCNAAPSMSGLQWIDLKQSRRSTELQKCVSCGCFGKTSEYYSVQHCVGSIRTANCVCVCVRVCVCANFLGRLHPWTFLQTVPRQLHPGLFPWRVPPADSRSRKIPPDNFASRRGHFSPRIIHPTDKSPESTRKCPPLSGQFPRLPAEHHRPWAARKFCVQLIDSI